MPEAHASVSVWEVDLHFLHLCELGHTDDFTHGSQHCRFHLSQWNTKINPHGVAQQVSLAVLQAIIRQLCTFYIVCGSSGSPTSVSTCLQVLSHRL